MENQRNRRRGEYCFLPCAEASTVLIAVVVAIIFTASRRGRTRS